MRESRFAGLTIAAGLWLLSVVLLGWEGFLSCRTEAAFVVPLAGQAGLLLVCLFGAGLFLEMARPGIARDNAMVLLVATISALSLCISKVMLSVLAPLALFPLPVVHALLPLAVAPLLTTILLDGVVGMAAGAWTSLVMALLGGGSFPLFIAGMAATFVTAWTAHGVRKRTKVVRTGLIAGLSETACILALTALDWQTYTLLDALDQAAAAVASGFFSALFVLLILPVLEAVFRVTTDISLLELSDLSHPLLQRLAIEAPGTYHHSLVVANLAQAAADEIGANGLLARVAAYFHDIGKLRKPDFFSENIQFRANPHDNLSPSMSTLVITAHVKEGLSLALVHKLPDVIRNALAQHHGTSLVSFFHHKAQSQMQEEADAASPAPASNGKPTVDEAGFRYPGPKPASREAAILCLADAVEAASRSVSKPTPAHIEDMVGDIVNARVTDGQLDESDLTLADLVRVKRSFVFTLTNMLHGRVQYPIGEDRGKQQAKPAPGERPGGREDDPVPDEPGLSS